MKQALCCIVLLAGVLVSSAEDNKDHGTYSPTLSKRAAGDTESDKDYVGYSNESDFSNFDREKSNTYKMSVLPPPGGSFIKDSTCNGEVTKDESSQVEGKKIYARNTIPSSTYIIEMSGRLGFSGGTETPATWGAYVRNKYFWIEPTEKIVAEGTAVTITAHGVSTESTWTVNNKVWKDWRTPNSSAYTTSAISLNRDMWDKMQWTPETPSSDWVCPPAGFYDIRARPTDNANVSDSGRITIVGANFTNCNCPGYDNYTNWNKNATDYYSESPAGRCTRPYFAVQNIGGYDINLNLIPTTPISKDVSLEENDISIFYLTPVTTRSDTRVGFVVSSLLFSSEGDITARLDGTTIANSTICIYERKNIKVLFVRVNNQSGTPDYSVFNQAAINVDTEFTTYTKSSLIINGETYTINSSTIWTIQMLQKLRDDFYRDSPNVQSEYDYVQFQVVGSVVSPNVLGWAERIPSRDSWISQNTRLRTYSHELGHCLGLFHRNEEVSHCDHSRCDRDALMCQTSHALDTGGLKSTKLRKGEWDALH